MFDDDFNKRFNRVEKTACIGMVVGSVITIGVLVFIGWVIVKVLQHFGIA